MHEDIPKCMPRVACPWQSSEFVGLYRSVLFDGVQLPLFRGFESRRAPKAHRQWLGFVLRDAKRTVHEIVCENVFIQTFVIIRQSESASVHLAEQCKSKPCLRMDTVLSQTVPKDFFPHCAGGTQIFSRCFCMNGNEATLLPLRRITYYEKDDYQ